MGRPKSEYEVDSEHVTSSSWPYKRVGASYDEAKRQEELWDIKQKGEWTSQESDEWYAHVNRYRKADQAYEDSFL